MLTEEKINANYLAFVKRLEKYGCYSEEMETEIGQILKTASFTMSEQTGGCYCGSLVDVVLNHLCRIGYEINETNKVSHPYLYVNPEMLMRVLLLQHISKCVMFIPQEQAWKRKNGYLYDFNNDLPTRMKVGERSIYLCQKYGIKLSEEEYEAIGCIDRDDEKNDVYKSPLSVIAKVANELMIVEIRQPVYHEMLNNKQKIEK